MSRWRVIANDSLMKKEERIEEVLTRLLMFLSLSPLIRAFLLNLQMKEMYQ